MPPALSVIGPKVSMARMYAAVASIPIVATAAGDPEAAHREESRDVVAAVEGLHRVLVLVGPHGHDADDRRDQPEGTGDEREEHHAEDPVREVDVLRRGRRRETGAEDHR